MEDDECPWSHITIEDQGDAVRVIHGVWDKYYLEPSEFRFIVMLHDKDGFEWICDRHTTYREAVQEAIHSSLVFGDLPIDVQAVAGHC